MTQNPEAEAEKQILRFLRFLITFVGL